MSGPLACFTARILNGSRAQELPSPRMSVKNVRLHPAAKRNTRAKNSGEENIHGQTEVAQDWVVSRVRGKTGPVAFGWSRWRSQRIEG